jgi:ubiquinone/menaquinone biosynthesis C-methylase UbiE
MSKLKPIIAWTPTLYDRLSKHYDRFAKWLFPIGERGREKVVSGLVSGRILDVACGTGTLLKKAHQSGLECIGIDTSRGMLLETKKKVPAADVVQASFYALPFAENQFDYVVETNAVSGADINAKSVLGEMLRVCAEEGELRLGDYGKSGREGFWIQLLVMIGILIGDFPHDYKALFSELGYVSQIENLGWGGMYQFIRVVKPQQVG